MIDSLSDTAYATKEELENWSYDTTVGKIVFGKDSSGNPLEWYILGEDEGVSGDNIAIFAVSPIITEQKFNPDTSNMIYTYKAVTGYGETDDSIEVYVNHYGASELRATLNSMADGFNENYFTITEQGLMNATIVETYDTKNSINYTITAPQSITVANGTVYTDMGLPTTVTIVTEENTVTTADVSWNTTTPTSGSYDPAVLTEQTVTLDGTVTCPAYVDSNGVELKTTISITISAAGIVGTPTVNPVAGTYTENQTVVLTTTTDGATIYYTTDGTTPSKTNGTKYTTPITVSGEAGQSVETTIKAIAVKDGMQDSKVETFEYIINIPMPKHTITATAGANGSIAPSGALEVTEGESKTFTITADEGYEIATIKVDGVDVAVETSYTFTNVTADHTIVVIFKQKETPKSDPVDYEIIEGEDEAWTLDADGNLTIKGNGDFSKFVGVKVDGELLGTMYYTAKEGSTIITLKAEYLNTLSVGKHTFEIVWNDGSAGTSFIIKENEIVDAPNTGDATNPLWFILLLVSGAGILLTVKSKYALKKED